VFLNEHKRIITTDSYHPEMLDHALKNKAWRHCEPGFLESATNGLSAKCMNSLVASPGVPEHTASE
jgi:hypothetical protein